MGMKYPIVSTCQIRCLPDILEWAFGDTVGFFVELGAYDGVHYSNTYGLAFRGWPGMYIEADRALYHKCLSNHIMHDGVIVEYACVGTGKEVDFYEAGEYSSASKQFIDSAPKTWVAKFAPPVKTKTVLLDYLLEKHNVQRVDLLSVDTEGTEIDVLNGFSIKKWKPRLVIVEAHEQHPRAELRVNAPEINRYFDIAGYKKIYSDELNNIYLKEQE